MQLRPSGYLELLLTAMLALVLSACSSNPAHETPYINPQLEAVEAPPGALRYRLLLLGDAGHSAIDPLQHSLAKAAERASIEPDKTSVVMLGDNIYYFGYPAKKDGQTDYSKSQLEDISHLDAQLQIAKRSGAELFLVPGNHDWYATEVDSQAQHVASFAAQNNVKTEFRPHQQGQDPMPEIIFRDGVSIIFLDSMWLIQAEQEPFDAAMTHLESLLAQSAQRHPDNIIIVTAHHPIETMGPHNRYYTSFAYRSVIAVAELFIENDQDTDHPRYQRLIAAMEKTLAHSNRSIYAAGHDHSLQVFKHPSGTPPQYRLVSGAANTSMLSGVGINENSEFALSQEGFMELDIYESGIILKVYDIHHDQPVHQQWLWK